jgi:hypothetical protein
MNLRERLQARREAYKATINKVEQPKEKVKEVIEPIVQEASKTKKKKEDV